MTGAVDYLRDPTTPGNQVEEGEPNRAELFRRAAAQLARMYAIARTHRDLAEFRDDIAFFEEVRMLNARFDAEERKARGEAVPPDIELYLKSLTASAIEAGGVTDIYAAAGIGRPDLSHLTIFNCGSYWSGVRSSLGLARKPSSRPGWYCIRRSRVLTSAVS